MHISLIACTEEYLISETSLSCALKVFLQSIALLDAVNIFYLRSGAPLLEGHGGLRASRALAG